MVTGDADLVLLVSVKHVEAFDVSVKIKFHTNPIVRKFRSMILLDGAETALILDTKGHVANAGFNVFVTKATGP
ncbi:hypothetical protein X766_32365 [Mesorhizobium sp. LSJC255A00]|uniref:hypothetical protein n=1 Tax=Mesorhizobium sp. LSJC255A00 TaxID=1287313 RepID=UPI0003CE1621|nr:hypothetical protein [Mesorhizobium sp. LSJC255A00]ESX10630.1 hypothetical protein X766_32365 [Mesorhizobium sp. LSJC255A00]